MWEESYALSELLGRVEAEFKTKVVTSLAFNVARDDYYQLELTDSRTNRIRYNRVKDDNHQTQAYFTLDKIDEAVTSFYVDIKEEIGRCVSIGPAAVKRLTITITGKDLNLTYRSRPSGQRFEQHKPSE